MTYSEKSNLFSLICAALVKLYHKSANSFFNICDQYRIFLNTLTYIASVYSPYISEPTPVRSRFIARVLRGESILPLAIRRFLRLLNLSHSLLLYFYSYPMPLVWAGLLQYLHSYH